MKQAVGPIAWSNGPCQDVLNLLLPLSTSLVLLRICRVDAHRSLLCRFGQNLSSVANCIEIRLFPFKKQWIFLQDTAGHVWAIQKRVTSGVGIALQLYIRSVDNYVRTKCPGLSGRRSVAASFPDQPLC